MRSVARIGIALACLIFSSCQDSSKSGTEGDGKKGEGAEVPADPGVTPTPEPAETARERKAVVPVALDVGSRSHRLVSGVLFQTDHPASAGRTGVAFLLPSKTKPNRAYVWLEEGPDDGGWESLTLHRGSTPQLGVGFLKEPPTIPVPDLSNARPVPSELNSLLTAAWGGSILHPTRAEPSEEVLQREKDEHRLQEEYNALINEQREVSKRPRYDPRASREESRLVERERSERQRELARELSDLRREASRLRIRLTTSSSSRRTYLSAPTRTAKIVDTPIKASGGKEVEGKLGLIAMQAVDAPVSGVLPGVLLSRSTEDGVEVLGMQRFVELCKPGAEGELSGYFRLSRSSTTLSVRFDPEASAFGVYEILVGVAPKGELPEDLSQAAFPDSATMGTRGYVQAQVSMKADALEAGGLMEGKVALRFAEGSELHPLGSFSFSLGEKTAMGILPQLGDSEHFAWKSPEDTTNSAEGVLDAILSKTLEGDGIVEGVRAGGSNYLVVALREPNRIKVLDLRKEEWAGELSLPEGKEIVPYAADAERVFVCDGLARTLTSYALPDLKKENSLSLPSGPLPFRMAAGYNASTMPLALLYERRVELRNPTSLDRSDLILEHRDRNGKGETGHASVEWSATGRAIDHSLRASPGGDYFVLSQSYQESESRAQTMSFDLLNRGGRWSLQTAVDGIPARSGKIYYGGNVYSVNSSRSEQPAFKVAPKAILPTGTGVAAISVAGSYLSLPAPPLILSHYPRESSTEPTIRSRAGALAAVNLLAGRNPEALLSAHLFFIPNRGIVVSLGSEKISIERLAAVDGKPLPALADPVPHAFRGKKWSYQSTDADGNAHPLKLIKGPEGASVDDSNSLVWNVPANYTLDFADFEIELGDPPVAQGLIASVHGIFGSSFRDLESQEVAVVPVAKVISFADEIDQLLPSSHSPVAAAISGNGRRATMIDLEKREASASYQSSSGVAAFGLGARYLYVWHLNGNILETRNLPDLTPAKIATVDPSLRLLGLVIGSAPGALPPLGLFATESRGISARTIDPETLELGPPVILPQVYANKAPQNFIVHQPTHSSNGGTFLFGGQLITRKASGEFAISSQRLSQSHGSPSHLTSDGATFLSGTKATDIASRRTWSANLGKLSLGSGNNVLWPDLDHSSVLAITMEKSVQSQNLSGYNYQIHFLDGSTQEVRHELTKFFEWDGISSRLFVGKLTNSRLLYSSRVGTLITVSADGLRLIARKIPVEGAK